MQTIFKSIFFSFYSYELITETPQSNNPVNVNFVISWKFKALINPS